MSWRCFLLEPTDRVARALRRYHSGDGWTCDTGWHEAQTRIEDGTLIVDECGLHRTEPLDWPRDDPRWPTHCACGYEFTQDDVWQLFYNALYRDPRDGREYALRDAPAGAMVEMSWLADVWHGADGRCYGVILPDRREWVIDGPARDGSARGPGWIRTGEPPALTARPSILTPQYHGWLTDGVLSDDLEGRRYQEAS
ncbi:MAG TPA: hypothetical protein VFL91_08485 [Thermomicrobiales bacterium]|nr:hypothetical protein [Thermomicrobiales bacterium]